MFIQFIDYSSAAEKTTGQTEPVGPEGRIATPNSMVMMATSWWRQNQCYRLHTSIGNPLLFDPVTCVWYQSIAADVQAPTSSECNKQEEEELVTEAEIFKD